jgi:hypothetical protein
VNNEQIDVVRRILDLADTVKEGLDYADVKGLEGDLISAIRMFANVVEAFAEIEEALPVVGLAENNHVQNAGASLKEALNDYLECLEDSDRVALANIMSLSLLPRYEDWHRALDRALRPHIAS